MHKFIKKQKSTILQSGKQISTFGWEVKKKWPEHQQRRRNIPGGFLKISKIVNLSAKSIWVRFEWKTMVEWLKVPIGITGLGKKLLIIMSICISSFKRSTILQSRKQISTFGLKVKKKWPEIQRRRRNIPGGYIKISKNVNPSAKSIWVCFEWKTMVEWLKVSNGATGSSKNLQIITQSFCLGRFNKAHLQRQSMTYFLVQV